MPSSSKTRPNSPLSIHSMSEAMPGSFRSRPDSPHPLRRREKRARHESTEREEMPETLYEDGNEPLLEARPSSSTNYVNMLLNWDKKLVDNILAASFTWLLLAGYVALPVTFTSIRNSRTLSTGPGQAVQKMVQHLPLLGVAAVCCGVGACGMVWLSWKWQDNYVWLVNRIIIPGLLNSAAGFTTTLINVYTTRNGFWSVTAIITAAVTGTCMTIMIGLFLVYDTWLLKRVKKEHEMEVEADRGRTLGR